MTSSQQTIYLLGLARAKAAERAMIRERHMRRRIAESPIVDLDVAMQNIRRDIEHERELRLIAESKAEEAERIASKMVEHKPMPERVLHLRLVRAALDAESYHAAKVKALDVFEEAYFHELAKRCDYKIGRMATACGLGRQYVRAFVKKHQIRKQAMRCAEEGAA